MDLFTYKHHIGNSLLIMYAFKLFFLLHIIDRK